MFAGLITIAGGIVAVSSLIVAREPDAEKLLDDLTPYQGWIGIVLFLWGVWATIDCVRHLELVAATPLRWILWTLASTANLSVGVLLGVGLTTQYTLEGAPGALARSIVVRRRLIASQALVGLFAVVTGAAYSVVIAI